MTVVRRLLRSAAALLVLALLAGGARADGAWTTLLRPLSYTDLVREGDSLWCASLEGGLLRYSIAHGTFATVVRQPGGMASNALTALAIDRSGRLWIGTQGNGLNRLAKDRATFALLNVFDGLPSDTVNILEQNGDTLWIGTPRGLALWDGNVIAGRLPDGINASPFLSNDVRGIERLGDDLWVATMDGIYRSSIAGGLSQWIADTLGLPRRDLLRRTLTVTALACDGRALIAVARDSSFSYDFGARRWVAIDRALDGRGVGRVTGLWDQEGVITGASSLGVLRWSGVKWKVVSDVIPSVPPRKFNIAVIALPDGRLVAASARRFCLMDSTGSASCVFPPGPPGNNLQDLVLDGPRLYVTTDEDGIGRLEGSAWRYWLPGGPLNDADTTFRSASYAYGLLVDRQSRKWVGCWNSGFERWVDTDASGSLPNATFEHLWSPGVNGCPNHDPRSPHTFSTSSALDSSGGSWFGMDTPCQESLPTLGLEYYAPGAVAPRSFPSVNNRIVRSVATTRDGRVWVGFAGTGPQGPPQGPTPGCLIYFQPPAPSAPDLAFTSASDAVGLFVLGLAAQGNEVWALAGSEVHRYRSDGTRAESYTLGTGAASDRAHHPVDVGPDGSVWIGTTHGLRRILPDHTIQSFNSLNSPIADEDIHTVRVDPATGFVWIASSGGLNRFDPFYVPPPPPETSHLDVDVYPNPAQLTGLGVRVRLAGDQTEYRGRVIDLGGRSIQTFAVRGSGAVVWDGHDSDGRLVRPGIYFVQVEAGGRTAVIRVAVVR